MQKEIILSAFMGIVLSFAIFTVVAIIPWPELNTPPLLPQEGAPLSPMTIALHVSSFSEPQGPGSEADLTIEIISIQDASNVIAEVNLPEGISLLAGNLTWIADLKANDSSNFGLRMKVIEVGNWTISARVKWYLTDDSWYGDIDRVCICVFENEIVLTSTEQTPQTVPPGWNELDPDHS